MPASAQQANPSAAPTQAAAGDTSTDIVVTAQRRSQNLKDVPIAVTALSPTTIEHLNIRTIDNIEALTPGLVFKTGYSFVQIYIRGVGVVTPTPGLEGPVALYVDGAYVPRGIGTLFDLLDTRSVEVLKGPQGTLYGRNATGGAILLNTADPTHDYSLKGSLEYGRFHHVMAESVVNLPATDTLAFRLAGRYTVEDGFIKNIVTGRRVRGQRSYTLRGKTKWTPTSDFSAVLALEYSRSAGDAKSAGRNASTGALCVPCGLGGLTAAGPYQVTEDFPRTNDKTRSYSANLQLQYDAGPLTIKSVTSYRDLLTRLDDDPDHSSLPLFLYTSSFGGKTFSEDVQVSSSFGGIFNFLAGAQYVRDKGIQQGSLFGAIFGVPEGSPVLPTVQSHVRTESYAAFAEAYIKPLDRLTITLGGRYSRDRRRMNSTTNPLAVAIFNPGGPTAFTQRVSYSKFTPRAVIAYDADIVSLYTSFTRGYKAGGYNTPAFGPQAIPIRPETMDSFEVGAKFLTPDRRGRLNIAAFRYNYKDLQVSRLSADGTSQFIENAATARGKGVEIDASYKLTDWLNLSTGGAYLDAKYRRYENAPIVVVARDPAGNPLGFATMRADLSGARLSRAPKWTGYVSADIEAPLGGDLIGRLSGIANYSSGYDFAPAAGGELGVDRQQEYMLVNLSGGVGPSSGAYEVGFYVDNLTKQKYYDLISTTNFGVIKYIAKPRTYGMRLKFQF